MTDISASDPVTGASRRDSSAEACVRWREMVDAGLSNYLERQRSDFLAQPLFAGLYEDLIEFVRRPGKRLRGLLFLLAHRAFAPEASILSEAEAGPVAVAVSLELLHAFILIHDDLIDRAETRRGLPTLHRALEHRLTTFTDRPRCGRDLALVLGDVLFALAQKCLLESGAATPEIVAKMSAMLLRCMAQTGFGEAADILYGARDVSKVSTTEIEEMYLLKTTRYTVECPLMMAATLHGLDADAMRAIESIARPVGLAFQIQNDLMEFQRFEVSDADVPADILEGKKTLLLRSAFEGLNETDQGLLQLCFSGGSPSEASVSKAHELIVKSGAVTRLTEWRDRLFGEADAEIGEAKISALVPARLVDLIRVVRAMAGVV